MFFFIPIDDDHSLHDHYVSNTHLQTVPRHLGFYKLHILIFCYNKPGLLLVSNIRLFVTTITFVI